MNTIVVNSLSITLLRSITSLSDSMSKLNLFSVEYLSHLLCVM